MTIIEFLTARLEDDEAYARRAFADHNKAEPEWSEPWSGGVLVGAHEDVVATFDSGISRHMVRHDPDRVLREIAAKRAILLQYTDAVTDWEEDREAPDAVSALRIVVRLMASVYSDHPDYQQEWAP